MGEGGTQIPPLPVEFGQTPPELFPLIFSRNVQERWVDEDRQNRELQSRRLGLGFHHPVLMRNVQKGRSKSQRSRKTSESFMLFFFFF